MASSRRLAVPAYYEIASDLRREIEAGELRPGDLIPSEAQLCDAYNVSRMTVRQGLNLLSEAGYIQSVPGKGSYVSSPEFGRMNLEVHHHEMPGGRSFTVSDFEVQITAADEAMADRLDLQVGGRVRELHRVLSDDGMPVGFERTYLPWAGTRVPRQDEIEMPFAELASKTGDLPFVMVRADVVAGVPDAEETAALGLKDPAFGLILEQTVVDADEEVVGFARTCYHPDRFAFRAEYNPFYKQF